MSTIPPCSAASPPRSTRAAASSAQARLQTLLTGAPSLSRHQRCTVECGRHDAECEVMSLDGNNICTVMFSNSSTQQWDISEVESAPHLTMPELKRLPVGAKIRVFQEGPGMYFWATVRRHIVLAGPAGPNIARTEVDYDLITGGSGVLDHSELPRVQLRWETPPPLPKTPTRTSKKRGAPTSAGQTAPKKARRQGQQGGTLGIGARAAALEQNVAAARKKHVKSCAAETAAASAAKQAVNVRTVANAKAAVAKAAYDAALAELTDAKAAVKATRITWAQAKENASADSTAYKDIKAIHTKVMSALAFAMP